MSKHGRSAVHRVCGLDALTGLITDETPEPILLAADYRARWEAAARATTGNGAHE